MLVLLRALISSLLIYSFVIIPINNNKNKLKLKGIKIMDLVDKCWYEVVVFEIQRSLSIGQIKGTRMSHNRSNYNCFRYAIDDIHSRILVPSEMRFIQQHKNRTTCASNDISETKFKNYRLTFNLFSLQNAINYTVFLPCERTYVEFIFRQLHMNKMSELITASSIDCQSTAWSKFPECHLYTILNIRTNFGFSEGDLSVWLWPVSNKISQRC